MNIVRKSGQKDKSIQDAIIDEEGNLIDITD